MTHTATPRLEAFKDTCGDYEKPHQYINRLHAFAAGLEIECASLKQKAGAHDDLVKALQAMCKTYGEIAFAAGAGVRITSDDWMAADIVLANARSTLAKAEAA